MKYYYISYFCMGPALGAYGLGGTFARFEVCLDIRRVEKLLYAELKASKIVILAISEVSKETFDLGTKQEVK